MRRKQYNNQNERILTAVTIAVVILLLFALFKCGGGKLQTTTDRNINITPVQIKQIKDIGQWEFLAIEDEELVDTVHKGVFSDDQLIRIYYGTIRLGIDLSKTKENWIQTIEDTIKVTLPPIELLDKNFIDEARTKPFFETGSWKQKDREVLYQKAKRMMLKRCLTKENIQTAKENAIEMFTKLLHGMGFKHIDIHFEKQHLLP